MKKWIEKFKNREAKLPKIWQSLIVLLILIAALAIGI